MCCILVRYVYIVIRLLLSTGAAENWIQAAKNYCKDYHRNYFTDLIAIHDSFGLTVRYKSAVALATIVSTLRNSSCDLQLRGSNIYVT